MEDAIKKKDKDFTGDIVTIDDEKNLVTVQLRKDGGYSYSFFNDVLIGSYLDEENKEYVINIEEKIKDEIK